MNAKSVTTEMSSIGATEENKARHSLHECTEFVNQAKRDRVQDFLGVATKSKIESDM
jgi:uncharacterized protein (DUF1810 family)